MTVPAADVGHTLALLESARDHVSVTRLWCRGGAGDVEGFVLGASAHWVLLAVLDSVHLDGYTAVRTPDIYRVEIRVVPNFRARTLQQRGDLPPRPPAAIALESTREVLTMAAGHTPLIRIEDDKDLIVGRVVSLTDHAVDLLEIDPDARWEDEPTTYAYDDIVLVGFGGEYDTALRLLGGDPPDPGTTG